MPHNVTSVQEIEDLLKNAQPDANAKKSFYFVPFSAAESQVENNQFYKSTERLLNHSSMRRLTVELYKQQSQIANSPLAGKTNWSDDNDVIAAFNQCPNQDELLKQVAAKKPILIQYHDDEKQRPPLPVQPKAGDTVYVMGHGDATVDYIANRPDTKKLEAPEVVERMSEYFPNDIGKIHLNNCGAPEQFQGKIIEACQSQNKFIGAQVVAFGPPSLSQGQAQQQGQPAGAQTFQPGQATELVLRRTTRDNLDQGMRSLRPMADAKTFNDVGRKIDALEKNMPALQTAADEEYNQLLSANQPQIDIAESEIRKLEQELSHAKGKAPQGKVNELLNRKAALNDLYNPSGPEQQKLEDAQKELAQAKQDQPRMKNELEGKTVGAAFWKQKKTVTTPDANAIQQSGAAQSVH